MALKNTFESHCNMFPLKSLVQDLDVAVYDLRARPDDGTINDTLMMSTAVQKTFSP